MAAEPGRDIPSASVRLFIVVAVPIVLQYPVDGAAEATSLMKAARSISPAARRSRARHTTVPEPIRLPADQPLSIGPTESAIAGMSTVAAAIRQAGVVLSQPVVSTTPSIG